MSAGRQLWLAGLGALGSIGRLPRLAGRGRRMMDSLVDKGQPLADRQRARRAEAAARIERLSGRASRSLHDAATLLRDTAAYESRRLLHRFDLATVEDLGQLAMHLDMLDKKLDDYAARQRPTAAGAPDSLGSLAGS